MSYKTVTKPKKKPLYGLLGSAGKKIGAVKIFETGQAYKPIRVTPVQTGKGYKPGTITEVKGGKAYDTAKMHHLGQDVTAIGKFTPEKLFLTSPQEDEGELAERLVAEVADHSADVKALCEDYQLKREELGRMTGFSLRALAEWASGKLPSQPAKRRLHEVRRLLDALAQIVKRESIPNWLHQPNPAFDRLTPLQVIELGEIDRLWAMVHDLGSGQPE